MLGGLPPNKTVLWHFLTSISRYLSLSCSSSPNVSKNTRSTPPLPFAPVQSRVVVACPRGQAHTVHPAAAEPQASAEAGLSPALVPRASQAPRALHSVVGLKVQRAVTLGIEGESTFICVLICALTQN